MKPLNFSSDNIANQFKYLKRNLKDLGIWHNLEYKVKQTLKFTIQNLLFEEFALYIQAGRYQRTDEKIIALEQKLKNTRFSL
jgi:hypothetical protein